MDADRDRRERCPWGMDHDSHKRDANNGYMPPGSRKGGACCGEAAASQPASQPVSWDQDFGGRELGSWSWRVGKA